MTKWSVHVIVMSGKDIMQYRLQILWRKNLIQGLLNTFSGSAVVRRTSFKYKQKFRTGHPKKCVSVARNTNIMQHDIPFTIVISKFRGKFFYQKEKKWFTSSMRLNEKRQTIFFTTRIILCSYVPNIEFTYWT